MFTLSNIPETPAHSSIGCQSRSFDMLAQRSDRRRCDRTYALRASLSYINASGRPLG
jgi:hypothetical protein